MTDMGTTNDVKRPNRVKQKLAGESYTSLISTISRLKRNRAEMEQSYWVAYTMDKKNRATKFH
ncbi:hypothetical protein SAMN05216357_1313 [Porphyromonadaceae bacterium KH3CP3RA]|nr:hypothetical protein SAMN05216357_1313 [Porphyromonadaceae bacterium KH3CP3RA]